MKNGKQIKWGAIISYVAMAFGVISGLLYTPWLIDAVGKDQYALYTLALSVINIFLMDFGISAAVTRFLSEYYAKGMQDEAERFMGIVYKIFFIISAAIAVCLFVFYFFIDVTYTKFSDSELTIFKHLFIIVAVYSVVSFPCTVFKGVLMANEEFIAVKLCGLGQKVLDVVLIVVLLLLGKGVYAMVLVHAFSNVVFHAIRYLIIKTKTKQRSRMRSWDKKQARSLFGYSIWITIVGISQRCMFNILPSIIAALIGTVEVTVFSLASTLESYVNMFSEAINGMFMPRISRIFASENSEKEINSLMCKVGKFHVYTIGLIIIGFMCVGKRFVELWLGSGNEAVYFCAVLLMLPCLVELPQQIARTSLLTLNIVKQQALIYIGMAVINITLSFVLVPLMGAIGAALSVCFAYFFRTFMFNILYKKYLPIKLGAYFKSSYLKWSIAAAITLGCGLLLGEFLHFNNTISFVIQGCVVVLVYIVSVFLFDMDKETKRMLKSKILKK